MLSIEMNPTFLHPAREKHESDAPGQRTAEAEAAFAQLPLPGDCSDPSAAGCPGPRRACP